MICIALVKIVANMVDVEDRAFNLSLVFAGICKAPTDQTQSAEYEGAPRMSLRHRFPNRSPAVFAIAV